MARTAVISALLVFLIGFSGCSGEGRAAHNGTNVLLIMLDTVRGDRFSCFGYDRPTTPNIDLIADRGVRFENFFSNSSWTLSSHASLFTGMYPAGHRATQETLVLSTQPPTLAEIFGNVGYQTFAASENPIVSVESGLARGFDTFIEVFRKGSDDRGSGGHEGYNNVAFQRFLASSDRESPFFAFLNYIAAHAPYDPPEPHASLLLDPGIPSERIAEAKRLRMPDHYVRGAVTSEDFTILNQLYDGEIRFLDALVFELLDILERDGRLRDTLVIITSDHGENLGEHGHLAHVFSIHNTLLKIPLIILWPDGSHAGETRKDVGQLLDLFPTILGQCEIEYSDRPEGRDLFAPGAASVETVAMAEYYYPRQVLSVLDTDEVILNKEKFIPFMRRLRAVQDKEFKLTWGSDGSEELYRIDDDPGELNDLLLNSPDHPAKKEMLDKLAHLVNSYHGDTPLDPPPPVGWMVPGFEDQISDPELLKKLRSLGYVK